MTKSDGKAMMDQVNRNATADDARRAGVTVGYGWHYQKTRSGVLVSGGCLA
jgi:hypothetical protein